jgi:gliding motility-associated-like protein
LEVPKLEIFPYLDQSGYDITKQFTCNPDGSITISAIESIQSGTPAPGFSPATVQTDTDMSEYLFTWYRGEDFNSAAMIFGPDIPGATPGFEDPTADGNYLNVDTYPDINDTQADPNIPDNNTYWVVFTKTTAGGIQCESSPEKFIIESDIDFPVISFTPESSTSCAPVAPNGRLEAVVRTDSALPGPGYNYSWFVGDDITTPFDETPGTGNGTIDRLIPGQETLVDVAPGIYTLRVEDVATGCFTTESFEVLDMPVIPNISLDNVTANPQDICFPSGSIIITNGDVSIGGVPGDVKDFIFTWTLNNPNGNELDSISALDGTPTGLPIQGPSLDATVFGQMGEGDYYVSVAPKAGEGAGCPGPPVKVVVGLNLPKTDINFSSTPNSSCPGGIPNGTIIATVVENPSYTYAPADYTWTYTGLPVDPVNITNSGNISTVINAEDGAYSLTINNPITGCTITRGFNLLLDRTLSEPNIIRVDTVDPFDCNPTARMEVIEIQIGGVPASINDFEYRWFAGSFDPANIILTDPSDPTSPPINTPNLELVPIGTYFVTAIGLTTNCESIAKEVNILDDNIIYPQVEVFQDRPQTSCDVNNPNGQLSALAEGQFDDSNNPNGVYTFTWFDESSTQIGTGSTLPDLGVGKYTVEVRNNVTGCTATDDFIIEDGTDLFRLQISMSAEPVTFCDINNGIVTAGISNHNLGNWQFTWTGPNGFSAVESGNNSSLVNVDPGEYTVSAIDLSEVYCPSLTRSIIVEDERIPPPIDMIIDSQLTNCYVDDPNGQITATAGGTITGFEFNWFSGTSAAGPVIETNNIISGLTVGSYTVEIIDRFTNCSITDFREIEDAAVLPPTPGAEVLSNLTDCLNPDGALEIVYEGNPTDYDFFWYDGSSATGTPANTETTYGDLDLGDYTTTVMDLTTGCISEGLTVTIQDERVYPEFTTKVTNANCDTSNGIIELKFEGDFSVRDVSWFDPSGFDVGSGQILRDQPTGDYTFEIVTFKNCEAFGTETIGTEITNYNGISANNDGANDGFQIDCITLFPNNNVKIFNRAGVKVYEADGYNNDDVIFDGIGLDGIYLAGQDLPDGTYFYVIDKGDGSRPVTGYLELIR